MVMSGGELRAYCLDFPATTEEYPFGTNPDLCTFKVEGKVFVFCVLTAPTPLELGLKCDPQIALALRSAYPAIVPGWHLNKRHWNTVTLDGTIADELVREMIQDSFDLVVDTLPKHQRLRLR
jgi:predicted DNA-binding protein (MmcQ/YjbR family)